MLDYNATIRSLKPSLCRGTSDLKWERVSRLVLKQPVSESFYIYTLNYHKILNHYFKYTWFLICLWSVFSPTNTVTAVGQKTQPQAGDAKHCVFTRRCTQRLFFVWIQSVVELVETLLNVNTSLYQNHFDKLSDRCVSSHLERSGSSKEKNWTL